MRETDSTSDPIARVVGPSMGHRVRHRAKDGFVDLGGFVKQTMGENAAHVPNSSPSGSALRDGLHFEIESQSRVEKLSHVVSVQAYSNFNPTQPPSNMLATRGHEGRGGGDAESSAFNQNASM